MGMGMGMGTRTRGDCRLSCIQGQAGEGAPVFPRMGNRARRDTHGGIGLECDLSPGTRHTGGSGLVLVYRIVYLQMGMFSAYARLYASAQIAAQRALMHNSYAVRLDEYATNRPVNRLIQSICTLYAPTLSGSPSPPHVHSLSGSSPDTRTYVRSTRAWEEGIRGSLPGLTTRSVSRTPTSWYTMGEG